MTVVYPQNHILNSTKINILVFFVGALQYFDLTIIARTPLGEILAFASLLFLIQKLNIQQLLNRSGKIFVVLLIWFLSVVFSDIVNQVPYARQIRGLARPFFCLMWYLFFYATSGLSPRSIGFYSFGLLVGSLQNYFLPQAYTDYRLEAGGYIALAWGLSLIIMQGSAFLAFVFYKKRKLISVVIFGLGGYILAILGSPRNYVLVLFLNAFLVFLTIFNKQKYSGHQAEFKSKEFLIISTGIFIFSQFFYYLYATGAESGWFGDEQQSKFIMQSSTVFGKSFLGLLLGGRTEVFAAILGIIENPVVGFGSWSGSFHPDFFRKAVDMTTTSADMVAIANLNGGRVGHSILFQTWFENGLLAALSLFFIFRKSLVFLYKNVVQNSDYAPIYLSLSTMFLWNYFFSPLAVPDRIFIGLVMAHYAHSKQTQYKNIF